MRLTNICLGCERSDGWHDARKCLPVAGITRIVVAGDFWGGVRDAFYNAEHATVYGFDSGDHPWRCVNAWTDAPKEYQQGSVVQGLTVSEWEKLYIQRGLNHGDIVAYSVSNLIGSQRLVYWDAGKEQLRIPL